MNYEYKLITISKESDIHEINREYLQKGWEVFSSVSQHVGGSSWSGTPPLGFIVFTLRKKISD